MKLRNFILLSVFLFATISLVVAKNKKNHARSTAADDSHPPPPEKAAPPTPEKKATSSSKHSSKSKATKETVKETKERPLTVNPPGYQGEHEFSIEDVDEDKITEILRDATKNLVVFFYDGRVKCPGCGDALSEVEEIDDDIEATGYIEVVKTDDRRVAREFGVNTFPALVYFRRRNPILYDGEFKDSEVVWRWLRAHDEVATWDLTDYNFEDRTDSFSPDESTLDWFVMFYDSEEADCNAFVALWETVAHKLRGLVNVGKVDTSVSDDVTERFRIDDNQCEFKDSEIVWRWLRAHDEVATWDLTDYNFEDRTDSFSPDESTLDWFVMFYDSEEADCNAFVALWETVAHKLRGLVNVGKVDTSVSDDVTERFRIDDNQCPTFLLFHRGKMYRYNDPAKDVRGLTQFALTKFKDQRGHRVPEPPTVIEHFYEHVKERVIDALDDNQTLTAIGVGGLIVIISITLFVKAYRINKQKAS
uniref:Thioredoxin domain-containing protein n=1 Tax=Acrobeloides nanus TaxID=290746 RepID=A0A914CCD1_9BILA